MSFSNLSGELFFDSVNNQLIYSSTSVLCGPSHLPVWDSQQKHYIKCSVSYVKIRHEKMELGIEAKNTTYPKSLCTPSCDLGQYTRKKNQDTWGPGMAAELSELWLK